MLCTTTIILWITTAHIQMQIQGNTKHRRLRCSRTNVLLTSWIRFFDTRKEAILKSLSLGTSRGPFSISQHHGWTPISQHHCLNSTSQLHLSASVADHPNVCLYDPKSPPNRLFFKIFKFSGPSLLGITSFTLQPHFSYLGFIMTIVIVITLARERKTVPNVCAPDLRAE